MRKLFYVILILIAVVAAGSCDRKGAQLDRTFDRADALMHNHPDSALAIMQSVDTTGLSRQHLARYALLMTSALDKNYIEPENDSLIKIALDYYCGQNNSQEIGALYYYGQIHYTNKSIDIALPILDMSYEMAMKNQNWYYAGMSARLLSDIYDKQLQFPLQIKYALLAKSAYQKYENENNIDDHRYSIWMDTSISEYFVNTDQYERCIQFCDSLEATKQEQSVSYYEFISINKAQAYCRIGEPEKSIHIYDSLINSGYEMEGYNWNRLSEFYFLNNEFDKSRIALDSAKSHTFYDQDKLYISYLEDLLSSNNDDKDKTIAALKNFNKKIIEQHNKYVTTSPFPAFLTSYKLNAEIYRKHLAKQKFINISLVVLIILIATLSSYLILRIIRKLKKNRQQNIKLANYQNTLEKEIHILEKSLSKEQEDREAEDSKLIAQLHILTEENKNLKRTLSDYRNLRANKSTDSNKIKMIKDSTHKFLKQLDKSCSKLFLLPSDKLSKGNHIPGKYPDYDELRSEKPLEYYDLLIDLYSDELIDTIKLNFPKLKLSTLRLIRYLCAGFGIETIMYLMSYSDRKKINETKSSIKKRIIDKKDWTGLSKDFVLRALNMKIK